MTRGLVGGRKQLLVGMAAIAIVAIAGWHGPAHAISAPQRADVQPDSADFQALQGLIERYGCIAGYQERSFRGNRSLTRYEFAAGLNACLDSLNTSDSVTDVDRATLAQLRREYRQELATLRGRTDALEAGTQALETQEFSPTTKLSGEAVFDPDAPAPQRRKVKRRPKASPPPDAPQP